jgi:hypothetical protein
MSEKYTYEQIAKSFELWQEYVDTSGIMSYSDFEAMSVEERVQFQVNCFGAERSAAIIPDRE